LGQRTGSWKLQNSKWELLVLLEEKLGNHSKEKQDKLPRMAQQFSAEYTKRHRALSVETYALQEDTQKGDPAPKSLMGPSQTISQV